MPKTKKAKEKKVEEEVEEIEKSEEESKLEEEVEETPQINTQRMIELLQPRNTSSPVLEKVAGEMAQPVFVKPGAWSDGFEEKKEEKTPNYDVNKVSTNYQPEMEKPASFGDNNPNKFITPPTTTSPMTHTEDNRFDRGLKLTPTEIIPTSENDIKYETY